MRMLKNKILVIISTSLVLLTMIFSSLAFSSTYLSIRTAEMNVFDQTCKADNPIYYYANIDIKEEGNRSIEETIFSNTYSKNFGGTSTRLLSVSGDNGIVGFKTLYNDLELPYETSPVSGLRYTNDRDLSMFETICINLLLYREKSEETHIDYDKYDGFIYIPDYYADYIIENSDFLNNYLDIINANDTNVIYFEYRDRIFKYRIANIFHVKGFNPEYSDGIDIKICDYNNGQKLDYLFNGYCFVSNYNHFTLFDDRFHTTFVLQIGAKKYELEENLQTANRYRINGKSEEAKATIFYYAQDGLQKYNNSDKISSLFFGDHTNKIDVFFTISFAISLISYLFISFLCCYEKFDLNNDTKLFVIVFFEVVVFLLIGFILKKSVNSHAVNLFFNPYSSGVCVGIMIITAVILALSLFKRQKRRRIICV